MLSRANVFGLLAGLGLTLAAGAPAQASSDREDGRLLTATQVMEELTATRDQAIPDRLLERAYGIAVVPDVNKLAFIAGGRFGRGVVVVRGPNGNFSSPVFIRLSGGSVGFQAGVQQADIVLVFTTKAGIEGITGGKVTLGGDVSVAAGPVGRAASMGTDANFAAEVYSSSRARGLFAGVSIDGSALSIDRGANARFYNKADAPASEILSGAIRRDDTTTQRFLAAITRSTNPTGSASTGGTTAPVPQPAPTSPNAAPAPSSGATTYPMEDPAPGQEPK